MIIRGKAQKLRKVENFPGTEVLVLQGNREMDLNVKFT